MSMNTVLCHCKRDLKQNKIDNETPCSCSLTILYFSFISYISIVYTNLYNVGFFCLSWVMILIKLPESLIPLLFSLGELFSLFRSAYPYLYRFHNPIQIYTTKFKHTHCLPCILRF